MPINLQSLPSDYKNKQQQHPHKALQKREGYSHDVLYGDKQVLWSLIPLVATRDAGEILLKEVISAY